MPPAGDRGPQAEAQERGLWNLFLPHKTEWTDGLSNLDYAPLAEIMGRSPLAPEALNCSAPDTGNMEILTMFGTARAAGAVAASAARGRDPLVLRHDRAGGRQLATPPTSSCRIERDGDDYVINGRKWWISGAARQRCQVAILMGKTDPDAPPHRQQSMVLVPAGHPGRRRSCATSRCSATTTTRATARSSSTTCGCPVDNLLGEEGGGFAIAQARLGPGRIHHCMRAIGVGRAGARADVPRGCASGWRSARRWPSRA